MTVAVSKGLPHSWGNGNPVRRFMLPSCCSSKFQVVSMFLHETRKSLPPVGHNVGCRVYPRLRRQGRWPTRHRTDRRNNLPRKSHLSLDFSNSQVSILLNSLKRTVRKKTSGSRLVAFVDDVANQELTDAVGRPVRVSEFVPCNNRVMSPGWLDAPSSLRKNTSCLSAGELPVSIVNYRWTRRRKAAEYWRCLSHH